MGSHKVSLVQVYLQGNFSLGREVCQQAEADEFLCIVAG